MDNIYLYFLLLFIVSQVRILHPLPKEVLKSQGFQDFFLRFDPYEIF